MKLREKKPALLLIDIQKGFQEEAYWGGNRNNKNAEMKAHKILEKWRELKLPVYHIRHSSTDLNSNLHASHKGFEFHDLVKPKQGEIIITKNVNSAFIGTTLREQLDSQKITTLIIAGLTTNHCVSTTARMAGNFGYETYLIADATAAFDRVGINDEQYSAEIMHLTALASLKSEFATIWNAKTLLKEL